MKTVIIGGVAGGATAAARLRRLDEKAEIIILERGEYVSFANCGLPYYIGGVITEKGNLTLQTPESFKARFNIDVRTLNNVVSIDPTNKTIAVENLCTGKTYEESYDRLILSPGAEPIRPNIDGIDSPIVFTLRNIPDTMQIKGYIETAKPRIAVIVGGGYIGVEMAENIITGKIKQFFWHDVENLPRDGSVTLLDTRTSLEVSRGKIEGFIHIPLDSLRERIDELPKDKPVYVHCHSGLRSYIACRILSGNGFDCYNLAGGWRLYESVINERTVPEYICTECK